MSEPSATRLCRVCGSKRDVGRSLCRTCQKLHKQAYDKERYPSIRDNKLRYMQGYHQTRVDHRRRYMQQYNEENKEELRQKKREYQKRTMPAHAARTRARELRKQQATPKWATATAVRSFYEEAARRTEETGVQHHVDHIVPINSKYVCGLHCEANLQVITYEENLRKSNRWWPDMPQELEGK